MLHTLGDFLVNWAIFSQKISATLFATLSQSARALTGTPSAAAQRDDSALFSSTCETGVNVLIAI
jgi:hypothetical protein